MLCGGTLWGGQERGKKYSVEKRKKEQLRIWTGNEDGGGLLKKRRRRRRGEVLEKVRARYEREAGRSSRYIWTKTKAQTERLVHEKINRKKEKAGLDGRQELASVARDLRGASALRKGSFNGVVISTKRVGKVYLRSKRKALEKEVSPHISCKGKGEESLRAGQCKVQ